MALVTDQIIAFDCEVYPNYFLIAFKDATNKQLINVEITGRDSVLSSDQISIITRIFAHKTVISFNGERYDVPIISYALMSKTCEFIHKLSDAIITNNLPRFMTMSRFDIRPLVVKEHYDIMNMAPAVKTSLKTYGARIGSFKLQDLPISPGTDLSQHEIDVTRRYCENDLDTLTDLYNQVVDRVELRRTMTSIYKIDLSTKSEAQMAEIILKQKVIERSDKKRISKVVLPDDYSFKYTTPSWFTPNSGVLRELKTLVNSIDFTLTKSGSVKSPRELSSFKIQFGTSDFACGVGGLHSKERGKTIEATDDVRLFDRDVESYYPNILLSLGLYPPQLGPAFLDVYREFLATRLDAKAQGLFGLNDALKVVLNGTFGKLGSKFSALYSPYLLTMVTITGQLGLLLLIEKLDAAGFNVESANTDGVVTSVPTSRYQEYDDVCAEWCEQTRFKLDETEYRALYSASVNDYIAVKTSGVVKAKGRFNSPSLRVNPHRNVCITAIVDLVTRGIPLAATICKANRKNINFYDFVTAKAVTGGAVYDGEYVGKTVRFVYTKTGKGLFYQTNGNKVQQSTGAEPVMELGDLDSYDIDYERYVSEAEALTTSLGFYNI